VMIRADGTEATSVMDLPLAEGFSPGTVAITPDGRRVVYSTYQSQSDVWIATNFDGSR
jgi:hypothetical protein